MSDRNWRRYLPLVALALAIVGMAFLGYLILERIDALNERIAGFRGELQELRTQTEQAQQQAESAQSKSAEAEQLSRIAAEGRLRAEQTTEAYREIAEGAEREAAAARESVDRANQELQRLRQERSEEMTRLQRALSRIASTRRTSQGLVMSLGSESINFDFDRAELRPSEREILSRIAGILLTSYGYRVQVYGHTDDVGTKEYNLTLSERRAEAVRAYLVSAGLDPGIITTKGFGKSNPLVSENTPDARAKNRRVEIGIIDTLVTYEGLVEGN